MKKILAVFMMVIIAVCSTHYLNKNRANASDKCDINAKITETLKEKMDNSQDGELIDVYIFLTDVEEEKVMEIFASEYPEQYEMYLREKEADVEFPVYDSDLSLKNPRSIDSPVISEEESDLLQNSIESKRAIYKSLYSEANEQFLVENANQFENIVFVSMYSPMIIASMYKDNIISLIRSSDVSWMDLFEEGGSGDELAIANETTLATYVRDTCGNKGSGVKIGQIEGGLPNTSFSELSGQSITINSGTGTTTDHATRVASILVGKTNGIVPQAQLYSTGFNVTSQYYQRVEWLISQGVNVINMSAWVDNQNGGYDTVCKWTDHVAITHDIHFVKSAGNLSSDSTAGKVTCPGMAYNVITVGGYNDNNTSTHANDVMCTFSSYEENGSTGRPEKPNLIAPAENIYIIGMPSGTGTTDDDGTSFAAPQVAAIIAQLCSYNSGFKIKQSAVSAMLMASASRKLFAHTGGSGNEGESFILPEAINAQIGEREGAGKVDSRWLRGIALRGLFWSYTINQSQFPYTKYVTINASGTSLTRVAIFWLKRNSISGTGHTPGTVNQISFTDLDLRVYDPNGNQIGNSSVTTNSNFEIVQFVPTLSGQYKIEIKRVGTSTSDKEIVGIAVW